MINYVIGDATRPVGMDNKLIIHVCNNIGGWGAGFVLALSRRWPKPEIEYRKMKGYTLGDIQIVQVEPTIWVGNLIGQHDIRRISGVPPIRYDAVRKGLSTAAVWCLENNASVHCPRFGAGLAGGDWGTIETIIKETLVKNNIPVTVYDLQPQP